MAETTEELVLDSGPQLIELVNPELPMVVSRSAPVPRRTLIAVMVKVTAIMRAIVDLIEKKRLPEVMILGRSLADHVITLAWITADVDQHYPRWERDDAKQHLDAHKRADIFWATRLGFPAGDHPFMDTYMVIFRHSSNRTHASILRTRRFGNRQRLPAPRRCRDRVRRLRSSSRSAHRLTLGWLTGCRSA